MSLPYAGLHVPPDRLLPEVPLVSAPAARPADVEVSVRGDGPSDGRGVHATWLYTLGSIVFFFVILDAVLVFSALESFTASPTALSAAQLAALVIAVGVQLRYCWFLRAGRGGGSPSVFWTAALLTPAAIAWVLGLFAAGGGITSAVPMWMAIVLYACLVPEPARRWTALAVGFVLVLLQPYIASLLHGEPYDLFGDSPSWLLVMSGALLPLMVWTSLWWWEIVVTLDRHRRVAAELAVAQERLRFASDLHDIQGHHLQVIALKAELADRLLAVDPAAARQHLHETRLIAKQALEETRSLVSGYRDIALEVELENAREVLAAAGARCELDVESLPVEPVVRRALAMVVREATTNILRHSAAVSASITLRRTDGGYALEIANDGTTSGASARRTPSTGLAGLRERVTALGGRLDTATDAAAGRFELRAWIPSQPGGTA